MGSFQAQITLQTRTYIYICQPTYYKEQLQHFTERLEGNLKNVLQRRHVDTQKIRFDISRVESQCLNTCEVLEKLKKNGEAK